MLYCEHYYCEGTYTSDGWDYDYECVYGEYEEGLDFGMVYYSECETDAYEKCDGYYG
jgi:hypothetical protein